LLVGPAGYWAGGDIAEKRSYLSGLVKGTVCGAFVGLINGTAVFPGVGTLIGIGAGAVIGLAFGPLLVFFVSLFEQETGSGISPDKERASQALKFKALKYTLIVLAIATCAAITLQAVRSRLKPVNIEEFGDGVSDRGLYARGTGSAPEKIKDKDRRRAVSCEKAGNSARMKLEGRLYAANRDKSSQSNAVSASLRKQVEAASASATLLKTVWHQTEFCEVRLLLPRTAILAGGLKVPERLDDKRN
jgi:hypothetical protein